ncbi:MAG: hypothetical protein KBT02_02675 [Treponema sp.]|nr:hypothetical protein [Candidatus Treponema caballi]
MLARKKIISVLMLFISCSILNAQVINDSQMIPSNHWIYTYFNRLEMETGKSLFTDNTPISVAEARINLSKINKENLSMSGLELYKNIEDFLSTKKSLYTDGTFSADTGLDITVEGYQKTNDDIPWDFDYNYNGSLVTVPLRFAFEDSITLENHLFLEKNWFASQNSENFSNIPFKLNDIRFQFPDFAYGSYVLVFNDWGISFHIGKQGRRIGFTETGSLVYNDTFETDMYSALSIFSPTFKYTLDVSQVSYDQFLYMHQVQGVLFSKLKLTYLQAAMINDGFALRQINPMMVMHSFMGNFENYEPWEKEYYNESDVCAYLGLMFDYYPVKRLRVYGSYVQTELQVPSERHGAYYALPNGLGGQFGVSYYLPSDNNSSSTINVETVYTTPYLYIKQTPRTSLVRLRYTSELLAPSSQTPVATWIGTPFGPDCFAVNSSYEYEVFQKWSVKANYLLKIHGENNASMLNDRNETNPNYIILDSVTDRDGTEHPQKIYNYYPFAKYKLATNDAERENAINEALDLWMSGIPEYEHQIAVSGKYIVNDNLSFSGLFAYDIFFNCNNIIDNFQTGFEAILSRIYKF